MSQFFAFSLKIMTIEPFDPDMTEGYDEYEKAAGYATIEGQKIKSNPENIRMVTVMIGPGRFARCPVDIAAMGFKEDQEIKVIMGGTKVVCLANIEEKRYVYFNSPLRKKYIMPKVVAGANMAMVSAVAGYILALIFSHQQSKIGLVIVEGGALFLFISSIIYSVYYFSNDAEAHTKLRQYLKKLLK